MAFSGLSWPALKWGNQIRNTAITATMPSALTGNGTFEYRVNRSAYTRFEWEIPGWMFVNADMQTLLEFWNSVGGKLYSWLYTDPVWNSFSDVVLGQGTQINPPAAPTVTSSTSGGTLPASTSYTYGITALNAQGESTESATTSVTTGSGATNSNAISWPAVAGATGYNVYQGGEFIGTTTSTSFTDTGINPTSQTPPSTNGTGTTAYPLIVPVAGSGHPIWHPSGLTVNGSSSGFTFAIVNAQPVIQYAPGSCPAYGTNVSASGGYGFAVRFNMDLQYTLLMGGAFAGAAPAKVGKITFMEVFE